MSYTNVNGKLLAAANAFVSPDTSAFRYGVGLFETMLVVDGKVRLGQYHWQRLFGGLTQLRFEIPARLTPEMLEEEVLRTVAKNSMQSLCRVRLQLYGGSGGIFGPADRKPMYVVECYPLGPEAIRINDNGLVVGIAEGVKKSADSLSKLKSSNALVYAMAARQAKEHKWNDALVLNTEGNVIESAIANIFWIKDGLLFTPPLSEGCVAGVMRRHLLQTMANIAEVPLTIAALMDADEVFLTNAIKTVKWVGRIENKVYRNVHTRALLAGLF
jgi:branched-chain amino acid aminotransferase